MDDSMERLVKAVERIAGSLERLEQAAIYQSKGVEYIGLSINTEPDVMGVSVRGAGAVDDGS